jgi:chromosome partitioning protein
MANIIAFVSQKGGVGKSTLSRALAREAANSGLTVKIADLDTQQGTCVNWHRRRLDNSVEPTFSVESYKTSEQALAQADRYDLLIIDAPARASEGSLKIAQRAGLVVQPTNPAIDDLEPAVRVFHEMVKEGIPKSHLVFALNHVLTDAEEVAARTYLTDAGYAVLKGYIPSKTSYRDAQNNGRTITETRYSALNGKADALIEALIGMVEVNG